MKDYLVYVLLTGLLLAGTVACSPADDNFDLAAYRQDVMDWRDRRLERLLAPTGYLNQTGLYWLDPGRYRFGTSEDNDLVIAGEGAGHIGVFDVSESGVSMTVNEGVIVRHDDEPVTQIDMAADTSDAPVMVTHGSIAWSVVERVGRYGIRLRDFEHPFVATFGPLQYYEIDPALRVQATMVPYDEPRIANVPTVIEGLGYHPETPGVLRFDVGGETHELEAYTSGEQLFLVFGDMTSRDDTYGAGRFLYADAPDADNRTVLDFNKAYSPPCAFNDFSTCPVATPENRLPIRIEAGEKYDPSLHYSGDN